MRAPIVTTCTTENVAWKLGLPGRSWSSPVVWNDHIIVTTAVSAGNEPDSLNEMTPATPAIVRGSVFIRTQSQLYRITKGGRP